MRVASKRRSSQYTGEDSSISGIPDRYAATDRCLTLLFVKGRSTITESIFENRFKYLSELARMGANVKVEGNSATIEGVDKFSGARVSAPDLRAGAALVIADGMAADGITIVDDIVYIYPEGILNVFEEKLRSPQCSDREEFYRT